MREQTRRARRMVTRRALLKGSGALVIGFSLAGPLSVGTAALARRQGASAAGAAGDAAEERGAADGREDPARERERKLEQLKDLYLTAEAIGEENVDKHFDKLLARQRALISEYFKQSAAGQAGADVAPEKPRA